MTLIDKSRFYGIKKDDPDVNRDWGGSILLNVLLFVNKKSPTKAGLRNSSAYSLIVNCTTNILILNKNTKNEQNIWT